MHVVIKDSLLFVSQILLLKDHLEETKLGPLIVYLKQEVALGHPTAADKPF